MQLGRWRRRSAPKGAGILLSAFVGVGLALILVFQINARLRPVLLELARTQTSNAITAAIDEMVMEQAVDYTDLVTLERSANGDIVALTSNMAQVNILRAQLLDAALNALDGLDAMEIEVPIGTIFGWDLLSGMGPGVKVQVLYTGAASAEFENAFSSAGINQTCHQIFFHVNADILVLLPGRQYRTTVSTRVCVAETIIVGKVPETYLQLSQ